MRRRALLIIILAGLAGLGWRSLSTGAPSSWKRAVQEAFRKDFDSHERHEAVALIEPDDSQGLKLLFRILAGDYQADWYIREGAAKVLAGASDPETIEKLRKELKRSSANSFTKEGIAYALGVKKESKFVPDLNEALDDKSWLVREAAAKALGKVKDEGAIEALINTFEKEKNLRARSAMRQSLETITGHFFGDAIDRWKVWWEDAKRAGKSGTEGASEDEIKEAEEAGTKARHRTIVVEYRKDLEQVTLNVTTIGKGIPVIVLDDGDLRDEFYRRFYAPLEDMIHFYYIRLPSNNDFQRKGKPLKNTAYGIPEYPVNELVEAFEELRKETGEDRFALIAHGMSGWVAMRWAVRFPRSLSHLIYVSTISNHKAFSDALRRWEDQGKKMKNEELVNFAKSHRLIIDKDRKVRREFDPPNQLWQMKLRRMDWSVRFANPRDLLLFDLFGDSYRRESIGGLIPDFELAKEQKIRVPCLVIFGQHSLFTSRQDSVKIKKHYPKSDIIVFGESSSCPFVEENEKFCQVIRAFFKKYPYGPIKERKPREGRSEPEETEGEEEGEEGEEEGEGEEG